MLLAVLAAPTPAAADTIAPPLGVPVRQTAEQVRDDGRAARRYRVERDIRFDRETGGFRATITLFSANTDAPPEERRRYAAAHAPLLGRAIAIHLDPRGGMLAIDDLDAVWRAWTAGLIAAVPPGSDRDADALRAKFEALSVAQRQAMIGSMALELFAPPRERTASPAQPLTLASPPPFTGMTLAGTASVTQEAANLRVRSVANGRSDAGLSATVAVTTDRLIDPASGLVRSSIRRETVAARGAKRINTTSMTLTW